MTLQFSQAAILQCHNVERMGRFADLSHMANRTGPATAPRGRRNFIREWRKHRDLTLEQLAEKVDMSPSAISQIEVGRMGYSRDSLERLADALACEPGDLLSRPPGRDDDVAALLANVPADERDRIIEAIKVLVARH